jgi:fructokinase
MQQDAISPDSSPSDNRVTWKEPRPLLIGEVLFDVMPDGTRVLGGAPFNVAWHLQAFGLRPLMITRVGRDEAGDEVLEAMHSWGMDTSAVQRDDTRPTGRVRVDIDRGEPSFEILPDQAYDHLDRDRAIQSVAGRSPSVLYHGTLIRRESASRSAVDGLMEVTDLPVFIDVNLRNPWWRHQDVIAAVRRAKWVKVNETELGLLGGGSDAADAAAFRVEHGLDAVIVTKGSRGALVVDHSGSFGAPAPQQTEVVDTVGAGDAFSAVFILGLERGWLARVTLERALDFAAAVCGLPGATTRDRRLYSALNTEERR